MFCIFKKHQTIHYRHKNINNPLAISSALTNSLQFNKSGKTEYEAVVLPAPLHPAIMYKIGFILHYWRKIPQAILLAGFHLLVTNFAE